ncbi:uncharacterized protein FA14DRAFT_6855 [Meira miltonrushii]|uniref:Uncharacterized protein n=1 Tax=Meira miltonrushii TaxID=1280837 RepID=A0A316VGK7_9BASI|nr:uncharacterized protein FA14DRAFT_6855 [Meira miltonrushii]PWN36777.1 hypothetical protein FA14DRAFT_6855 [Meira miltonrushii]
MFWARCGRHQASLLRGVQGTSFRRAVTVGIENNIRPVTTLSTLDTLNNEHRNRNDTTRDNLDERIGECSKSVGKQRQIDPMPTTSSIEIDEANKNTSIAQTKHQTKSQHLKLDRINTKVRKLISKDQIDNAITIFQRWQQSVSLARQEEHLSSEKSAHNGKSDQGCHLYADTVLYLIRWLIRNKEKRKSWHILFALCQEEIPQDRETAQLLRIMIPNKTKTNLKFLLPQSLRKFLFPETVQKEEIGRVPKDNFRRKIDEDARQRLLIPIAIALVQEGDLRLANWLFERNEETGLKKMPVGTGNVFAEAVMQHISPVTGLDGIRGVGQITSALTFLENCQGVEDALLIRINDGLVRRFSWVMRQERFFSLLQPEEWRGMLRRLSLISLRSGPLMTKSLQSSKGGIATLISLHIKTEDYTYAKRLFELYQDYYGRYTNESPFSRIEFAWLFEISLKDEHTIDFVAKLFNHWLISDLSSPDRMPDFLPAQLRRYSARLMEEKRGDSVLPLLPLFDLESEPKPVAGQPKVVKRIERRAQARRIVGVFANASPKYFLEFIPFLRELLAFLRARSEGQFDEHLIELHLHVVDKSISSEKYASSLALMRAQMLSIVESMRQYAVKVKEKDQNNTYHQSTMTSRTITSLQMLYRRILAYLGDSLAVDKAIFRSQDVNRDALLADALNRILIEMQSLWSFDLEEIDRNSNTSAITICRLQIMMGRQDWQGAFALYNKSMHDIAEQWERFADFAETGRSNAYPPAPLALNVATRLALALGQGGQFDKARQVLSTYTHCTKQFKAIHSSKQEEIEEGLDADEMSEESEQLTRKIKDHDRLLIECTGIALLCMQNRKEDALGRIYSLERLGVFGAPPQPQTPLMFFTEERLPQKAGFNFNSNLRPTTFAAVAPSIGPTNKELTMIYIEALASIPMKARSADWQGLLGKSRKLLSDYTGA